MQLNGLEKIKVCIVDCFHVCPSIAFEEFFIVLEKRLTNCEYFLQNRH